MISYAHAFDEGAARCSVCGLPRGDLSPSDPAPCYRWRPIQVQIQVKHPSVSAGALCWGCLEVPTEAPYYLAEWLAELSRDERAEVSERMINAAAAALRAAWEVNRDEA